MRARSTWLPPTLRRRVRSVHSTMMRRGYLTALAQASRWGRLLPIARRAFTSVEVLKNLSYTTSSGSSEQVMDVYRPRQLSGPAPVVLYIHGGAFTDLSKDTHWMMGLAFAHAGYIVCNINYRLAPKHPFPAAIEDALAAAL
ncbi:MAG: alpha/beta hydrolase, partial [Nannocystaceae bacterium]